MKRFASFLFSAVLGVGLLALAAFVRAPTQTRWQYDIAQSIKAHTRVVQHDAVTRIPGRVRRLRQSGFTRRARLGVGAGGSGGHVHFQASGALKARRPPERPHSLETTERRR